MPQVYRVEQGDYLAQIAAKYGFTNFKTIWDDPKNIQLKQKRKNPNVLFPGDILFIPDKKDKQESRATTQVHVFRLGPALIKLRVRAHDVDDTPITDAKVTLELIGKTTQTALPTMDSDGLVEQDIQPDQKEANMTVVTNEAIPRTFHFHLAIGELDPETEPSGQQARLNNLGYFAGFEENDKAQLKWAIEEFQLEHMGRSKVTGVCNPETQQKLVEVHGS